MEDKVLCPLIDKIITPVECMENRDVKESSIPAKYKQKENWKEICKKCKYSKY